MTEAQEKLLLGIAEFLLRSNIASTGAATDGVVSAKADVNRERIQKNKRDAEEAYAEDRRERF